MLANPKVGMKVRWLSYIGIITRICQDAIVELKLYPDFRGTYFAYLADLKAFELSPEEQDQIQRQKHADKYL